MSAQGRSPLSIRAVGLAAVVLLLAACSSAPPRETARSAPPGHPDLPWSGGKYYEDDGPGAKVPEDIDRIADAVPRDEPIHVATSRPYSVFGEDYVPMTSRQPFVQEGRASWYGRKFNGKRTANGEIYDMYAMSAAHKTLPLPSYVRVTNLENGRSVIVRVNDRGPFHSSRIIDLSYAAAYKLGYLRQGSTRVRIETVRPGDEPAPVPAPAEARPVMVEAPAAPTPAPSTAVAQAADAVPTTGATPDPAAILDGAPVPDAPTATAVAATTPEAAPRGVYVQLGAFRTRDNAEGFLGYVGRELGWLRDRLGVHADADRYRLSAGPYPSADAAREAARRIADALDLRPFVVVR
ncbi:septal ring lytic transglycosylase RlpA family protein [Nitrogeniibacter mangrovi]|uniref:Endolytic peptidoglycan transglycosylase RlpA n=1 Tax=Nitrogeniibacter mangrovi TaxID=2016596 RepID=A0A6C1B052_9RHOO|nr:septal ring lytic transglycosylase RlpA family protein [Nitrogeniibacter mangrovi]QID16369.1 septal ring lytic transglycosylase RlpA family protein [Nitrogeniibacter mangrovi]